MLQNDFFKKRYMIFNETIPGQDRIDPNIHLCRTFLLGIYQVNKCVLFSHQRNKSVSFIFQREFTVLDLPSTKVPSVPSYGN